MHRKLGFWPSCENLRQFHFKLCLNSIASALAIFLPIPQLSYNSLCVNTRKGVVVTVHKNKAKLLDYTAEPKLLPLESRGYERSDVMRPATARSLFQALQAAMAPQSSSIRCLQPLRDACYKLSSFHATYGSIPDVPVFSRSLARQGSFQNRKRHFSDKVDTIPHLTQRRLLN